MTITQMPGSVRKDLEAMAVRGYPHETCGLLIGTQLDGQVQISRVVEARNLNTQRAHDRYELDPRDFLAADRRAHAAGLQIVGIWHSHPDHPAQPSETDRIGAWQDWSYVILSVTHSGVADLRSWRLDGTEFVEEEIRA